MVKICSAVRGRVVERNCQVGNRISDRAECMSLHAGKSTCRDSDQSYSPPTLAAKKLKIVERPDVQFLQLLESLNILQRAHYSLIGAVNAMYAF